MPKIKLTIATLALFAGCWVLFWILGGFTWPENKLHIEQGIFEDNAGEAWLYCFAMYLVGCVSLSLIEHKIGFFVPVSIRIGYICIGAALMAGSLIWWHEIKAGL